MDQDIMGQIVLLAIVTLISVIQNVFFAYKVENESKNQHSKSFQRTGSPAFEKVYTANQNCIDAYPTFLAVFWCAGLLCSQVPSLPTHLGPAPRATYLVHRISRSWGPVSMDTTNTLKVQAPATFAGLMYLFVRQKYFVGYLGEKTQSTPGYIFGKRIIFFLFAMSVAGILNHYLVLVFGSDMEMYIKTISSTFSPLLLIP